MTPLLKAICFAALLAVPAAAQAAHDIIEPRILTVPAPEYLPEARAAGIGGDVFVLLLVDKKGKIKVVDSYGPAAPCSDLDDPLAAALLKASEDAALRSTFEPATFKGKAIDRGIRLRYHFSAETSRATLETGAVNVGQGSLIVGKAIDLPKPKYPDKAQGFQSFQGSVHVIVYVHEDGRVHYVEPISGHRVFRRAALEAACKATFHPTLLDGKPIKAVGSISYIFYFVNN
jgi:TonB family protein